MYYYIMKNLLHYITCSRKAAVAAVAVGAGVLCVDSPAFNTDVYATRSALADGRWVKIAVDRSGMHRISESTLRSWGFSDPSKVKVYGYGGAPTGDALAERTYIDDVPQAPSAMTPQGLVFYAQGPVTWTTLKNDITVQQHNPFTLKGYYFLSDSQEVERLTPRKTAGVPAQSEPARTFNECSYHEDESVSLGYTGNFVVGEDFRYTPSREFTIDMPGRVEGTPVKLAISFVAKTVGAASRINTSINGTTLPAINDERIAATNAASQYHGAEVVPVRTLSKENGCEIKGTKMTVGIRYSASTTVNNANLNYITANYQRHIALNGGTLLFGTQTPAVELEGASATTHVWDVTSPLQAVEMDGQLNGSRLAWNNAYTGRREYAAWDESATLPAPEYVATVAAQNLHETESGVPDMVIFTLAAWQSEAERLARHHSEGPDSLKVQVVDIEQVFNEFSSGTPDVQALRRMLKMHYDRGIAAGTPLRYALIMGRPTWDYRKVTADARNLGFQSMPTWESYTSPLDENRSFMTDDIFAFLEDGSGVNLGSDKLCIAVGRMPVRDLAGAKSAVDKVIAYSSTAPTGDWRNQMVVIADDQDNAIHLDQAEEYIADIAKTGEGSQMFVTKAYNDAFELVGGTAQGVRDRLYRMLREGTSWLTYIGHASLLEWSGEKIFTAKDVNELSLKHLPVVYASTCEFAQIDGPPTPGAEIMWSNNPGGCIAIIAAVRPVYISDNGILSRAMASKMFVRNDDGTMPTIGEIYCRAKNNLRDKKGNLISNTNKLRYILMGDPAMRPKVPDNKVTLDAINGERPAPDAYVTIPAGAEVTLEGSVNAPDGTLMADFDGEVSLTMHDAEYSTTTLGRGEGAVRTFEEQGGKLAAARTAVKGGRFSVKLSMPAEISDNFRPAALNMYALSAKDGVTDAMGLNRDFYVAGYMPPEKPDTVAPVIETLYLNHESFAEGDRTHANPMVFATVRDDRGINLSDAGVGHQMSLKLDGTKTYSDVSLYFTPDFGAGEAGSVAYPIEGLQDGEHTLTFRVWDTSGNLAEKTMAFTVDSSRAPKILDVYSDANPATTAANFYVTHDMPDRNLTVSVDVYDLRGRLRWSSKASGTSDLNRSAPVTWDLTDNSGARVGRGIYLYRATVTDSEGETHSSATRRIAVTGR